MKYLLGLSATKKEEPKTNFKLDAAEPSIEGFFPIGFGTDADMNLEEMEVEGLGLRLEPLEEEPPPTPETSKTEPEETLFESSEEPEADYLDLSPESSDHLELKIDRLGIGFSEELEVSDSNSEDIILNISDLDNSPSIKNLTLEESKKELQLAPSPSQRTEQDTLEPAAPVLDLGNTEIILDTDEDSEPKSPEPPSPPCPAQSEELEIKLEIDDSDGPLTINNDEIPEVEDELEIKLEIDDSDGPLTINDDKIPKIEIEDLGLELENPDSPPIRP